MNWYISDDAFYYFKTAQNIAEGNGITFDGINPTNGFHPLWMILCIPIFALARFNLFLPLRIVAVVQIFLNAASGFFLYELVYEKISKPLAWITAIFWMFFPPIHGITTKLGLETGLNAFMLISFFYLLSKTTANGDEKENNKYFFWVGLSGVGVLFSRLDNIFVLLMVGLWLLFRGKMISRISQIDFLLILISAVASFFLRLGSVENIFDYLDFMYLLIGSSLVIKSTLLYLFHAYEIDEKKSGFLLQRNIFISITFSNVLIFAILFVCFDILHLIKGFPRSAIIIDWIISLIFISSYHFYWYKKNLRAGIQQEDISLKSNWRTWFGRAYGYFFPIAISLVAYLGFNYYYAGAAMPISGQIKRWWGTLPNSVYGQPEKTISGVMSGLLDPSNVEGPFWMLMEPIINVANFLKRTLGFSGVGNPDNNIFIFAFFGVVFFIILSVWIIKDRKKFQKKLNTLGLLPLFVGTFFQAMMYKSTGYLHAREWYWVGEILLIVLYFSVWLAAILEIIDSKLSNKKIISIITMVICGFLWGKFSISILQQFPLDGKVPYEYDVEGEVKFINMQTNPGDVIGMTGGGLTAYFVPDRTIINLDGLINSAGYFSELKDGNISDYLIKNNVKYIYGSELVLLDSDPYRWFFTDSLTVKVPGLYYQFYTYDPVFK